MAVSTLPSPGTRIRSTVYWTATVLIAAELGVGGVWDVARIPRISWCCWAFGRFWALALLVPGRPLPKEWAYAGAFFVYTGAIASHLTERYALGEVAVLTVMTALTVLSWALRPPGRRPGPPVR